MTMKPVQVTADMGLGKAPEKVRLEVTQGPHTLRSADVDPASPSAVFQVDDGDYVASATSLVPHGTPATAVFAVPRAVRITNL
jgi:hypothetical protein